MIVLKTFTFGIYINIKKNNIFIQKIKKSTHWITLYVHEEVYNAMKCTVAECKQAESMNLFATSYGKQIRLREFEDLQIQATITVIKYLKEPWLEKITQSIRMCLRDLGKGWFNLEQKDHNVYDIMKLKRFMNLTNLRMQVDTYTSTIKNSQSKII